MLGVAD